MKPKNVIPLVEIIDMSSTGKAVARIDGKVLFVDNAIPGDIIDVRIKKNKKAFMEGYPVHFHQRSSSIIEPPCDYFGTCGGCKWQNIDYQSQIKFKEKQVFENFTRIGKVEVGEMLPIMSAPEIYHFRNKLEFTFSNMKWLTRDEIDSGEEISRNGLGFHIPGQFDKILDIFNCHLQPSPSNEIRNFIRDYALENGLTFYDIKFNRGLLRNLVVRTTNDQQVMVILQVAQPETKTIHDLLTALLNHIPAITSCFYIVNEKKNDSYYDQDPIHFFGDKFLTEQMKSPYNGETIQFQVGPKSFYQTNAHQAENLYHLAWEWADIQPTDLVYDLYTGTGTIANYVAKGAREVVGIEYVEEAVEDARKNAELNGNKHLHFYSGDMKDLLTPSLFDKHGKPDIIITDPPRAGMHEDVVKRILEAAPQKIVYVSCNPATQARDIELLSEKYVVNKVKPVDMFPHTPHVENVALLTLKNN